MKVAARRSLGIATGLVAGLAALGVLIAPGCEQLHARGPMNTGHEQVECESCHRAAPGTLRQQLQSAARDWVGLDQGAVDVGYRRVDSKACTTCHVRPDDRHPTYRFLEPRFAAARAALHPEQCESCHREHAGVRVTSVDTTFCRHCHRELTVKQDPIDVPHATLVSEQRWETCLGCHDFHGNHTRTTPRRLEEAFPVETIRDYFGGGTSPYGAPTLRASTRTTEVQTL